jgi:pilus assembly protein CpaB
VNRRKLTGVIASVVVAALGTIILLKSVNSKETKALPPPAVATVDVLRVIKPVPQGTPAEALADSVEVQQVPESEKLADAIVSVDAIKGMVAKTDLLPREQISQSRFQPQEELRKKEIGDDTGYIKVWIELDRLAALNGDVQAGDTVALFANFTGVTPMRPEPVNETQTNPTTHLIVHKALVVDCSGCNSDIVPVAAPPADGQTATTIAIPPTVRVQIAVDAPAAERVVFAAKYGSMWLGYEGPSVIEDNTKIVDRSNVYDPTPLQVPGQPTVDTPTTTKAPAKPGKPGPQTVDASLATEPAAVPADAAAPAAVTPPAGAPVVPAGAPAAAVIPTN